jgi:hypothetical protein
VCHLRERVRGRLQRGFDLAAELREVEVERELGRPRFELLDHAIDEEPVAEVGRNPSR